MLHELLTIVLGIEFVGKSALSIRYFQNQFVPNWDPTVEDIYEKRGNYENLGMYNLQVQDTAGQECFRILREDYIGTERIPKSLFQFITRMYYIIREHLEYIRPMFISSIYGNNGIW